MYPWPLGRLQAAVLASVFTQLVTSLPAGSVTSTLMGSSPLRWYVLLIEPIDWPTVIEGMGLVSVFVLCVGCERPVAYELSDISRFALLGLVTLKSNVCSPFSGIPNLQSM